MSITLTDIPHKKDVPLFPDINPFSSTSTTTSASNEGMSDNSNSNTNNKPITTHQLDSIMSEFTRDETHADTVEGMLTGTDFNMNLLQGNIFSYGKNDTIKNPIQPFTTASTTSGGSNDIIVSYKEGLTNDDDDDVVSTSTTGITSAGKSQKLIDLEKKLTELTTKYTTQYRLYTDDLLTRSQFLQTNTQYLGKLVRDVSYTGTDASASFYYVNNYGYAHRYADADSITKNDTATCPTITTGVSVDPAFNPFGVTLSQFTDISGSAGFSRFADYTSYNMAGGVPCIVAKNVSKPVTGGGNKFAWVDVEGRKHEYADGIWPDKRHSTCLSAVVGEPVALTESQYNAIPVADSSMNASSECFRTNVSPSINTKLADLKKKIEDVVAEIKKENQNIVNTAANTTIVQREKTFAEKWADLDEDILAQIKTVLGDYYYPAVYLFWCCMILLAILLIFKIAFLFVAPGSVDTGNGESSSSGISLLGVVILSLIVIFVVFYYFKYTYNATVSVQQYNII
jgi:hypothetical protein